LTLQRHERFVQITRSNFFTRAKQFDGAGADARQFPVFISHHKLGKLGFCSAGIDGEEVRHGTQFPSNVVL
jgi:hypothetical protein